MANATFDDLDFKPRGNTLPGVRAEHTFANGYAASVVRGLGTYGAERGLYELAVLRGGRIVYDTPITDDVLGCLSESAVTEALQRIEALPIAQQAAA